VPPGDNTVVTVTLYAKSAFKLLPNKHLLNIGVRGGPQLKLGIKADLELPDIDVLTDEIDFVDSPQAMPACQLPSSRSASLNPEPRTLDPEPLNPDIKIRSPNP
jgi:hypothetical protein